MWVPVKNQFNFRKLNLLKVCSTFSQVLKVFSRGEFEKAVPVPDECADEALRRSFKETEAMIRTPKAVELPSRD